MTMYNFENYTLVVYETSKEYHDAVPEHRFVAYLKEIPEASLHEYGSSQENAISNLRVQFDALVNEARERGISLPAPEKRDEVFSGRIVLRMPPWLHRTIDRLADEEGSSTNSYIVNRLIKTVTIEETVAKLHSEQQSLFRQLRYAIRLLPAEAIVERRQPILLKPYAKEQTKTEYTYKKAV